MFKKYSTLVLASLLGIGAFAIPVTGASAAALPYVQQNSGEVKQSNALLEHVKRDRDRRRFNRNRGHGGWGNNHRRHRGHWRHGHNRHRHHHGFGDFGYFAAPFIIGGALAYGSGYGYGRGGDHVSYCFSRYPNSYNPGDNTWVSYNGRVYECRSPYRY